MANGPGHTTAPPPQPAGASPAEVGLRRGFDAIRFSLTVKLLVIGGLLLVLLIPVSLVQDLIREREGRKAEAVSEIASKWGAAQTVTGPVLAVPYRRSVAREDGSRRVETHVAWFLPTALDVGGALQPEVRYRGIYRAVLYEGKLELSGRFRRPDFASLGIPESEVQWDRAVLELGLSDMVGIREAIVLETGSSRLPMNPGVEAAARGVLDSGVSVRLPAAVARGGEIPFRLKLDIDGSDRIHFIPVGEVTRVSLSSSWTTPSFDGAFLPAEREVRAQGFSARWKVLHLNRNYPQAWIGREEGEDAPLKKSLEASAFGVRLFVAADVYQQATRTAKYAALFIVLTFAAFFFSEVLHRRRLHAVQYLLVGLALVLFYTLLIALSEHLRFGLAYLCAAAAVAGLVTVHAYWSLASARIAAWIGGLLAFLYGYLYVLLRLEDASLLLGSLGLFAALAAIMYVTRRIDWHGAGAEKTPDPVA